jgi:hypothetical protein
VKGARSKLSATTTFTVTAPPIISVAPTSGAPGSSAQVSGSGFAAGETVTVLWCAINSCNGAPVLGSGTADSSGAFGGNSSQPPILITIPSAATVGTTYAIVARGVTSTSISRTAFTVT